MDPSEAATPRKTGQGSENDLLPQNQYEHIGTAFGDIFVAQQACVLVK